MIADLNTFNEDEGTGNNLKKFFEVLNQVLQSCSKLSKSFSLFTGILGTFLISYKQF